MPDTVDSLVLDHLRAIRAKQDRQTSAWTASRFAYPPLSKPLAASTPCLAATARPSSHSPSALSASTVRTGRPESTSGKGTGSTSDRGIRGHKGARGSAQELHMGDPRSHHRKAWHRQTPHHRATLSTTRTGVCAKASTTEEPDAGKLHVQNYGDSLLNGIMVTVY
jgi:hypothetical protein